MKKRGKILTLSVRICFSLQEKQSPTITPPKRMQIFLFYWLWMPSPCDQHTVKYGQTIMTQHFCFIIIYSFIKDIVENTLHYHSSITCDPSLQNVKNTSVGCLYLEEIYHFVLKFCHVPYLHWLGRWDLLLITSSNYTPSLC